MTQDEIIQTNFAHVAKSVCQLYVRQAEEDFRGVGTGVLVQLFGMHLLLTAEHCLFDRDAPHKTLSLTRSYINAGNGIVGLGGKSVTVDNAYSEYITADDDVAWINLDPDVVEKLQTHRTFLRVEDLSVKDDLAGIYRYMILGVRGFNTKSVSKLTSKDVIPTGYMAINESDNVYKRGKFSKERTLITRFNRKKAYMVLTGKREKIAFPSGVSGGAVFTCSKISNGVERYVLPKLVGIVNTFDEHLGHVFVSTKLNPYIHAIMNKYKINVMSRADGEVLLGFPKA